MGVEREVLLPDIGDFENVDVAEVLVSAGDRVEAEDSLIVLESDKASMEIPAPFAGVVKEMKTAVGDQVSRGALIAILEVDAAAESQAASAAAGQERAPERAAPEGEPAPPAVAERAAGAEPRTREGTDAGATPVPARSAAGGEAHAGPAVRRLAREVGVDLRRVSGSGRKGRILAQDVQGHVKSALAKGAPRAGVPAAAPLEVDFSRYGPTESQPLDRIRKIAAAHLQHSWASVPHVTQFDEADITELDAFRRDMQGEAQQRGVKLTFLPFVLKACAHALAEFPRFNASLDPTGEHLVLKRYCHIGVAVDTERGLVVPVVRDADTKGLYQIAAELMELSAKARARKLLPSDLEGGSFSISSLGGIGGTFFTPIVNHPEVAVLGVSRMAWKPVLVDGEFTPRLILPLSLSYDHRVIDGADAARFTTRLAELLSDLRRLIL